MKSSLKLTTLCLALAGASLLQAQPADNAAPPPPPPEHGRGPGGPGGPGGRGGPTIEMITERLGLTADQQAKIGPILQQAREQGQAIWNDQSLTPDQKREKGRVLRETNRKAIAALLTPEQLAKFKEMRGRGHRDGDGQQPPPPPPPAPGVN